MSVINNLGKNFELLNVGIYVRKKELDLVKKAYALILPVPSEEFANYEYCPIELLYSQQLLNSYSMIKKRNLGKINSLNYVKNTDKYMNSDDYNKCNDLWLFEVTEDTMSKNEFAEKIKNDVSDKEIFQKFIPLFENINKIVSL